MQIFLFFLLDFHKTCLLLGECLVTHICFHSCHHGVAITKGESFKKNEKWKAKPFSKLFVLCQQSSSLLALKFGWFNRKLIIYFMAASCKALSPAAFEKGVLCPVSLGVWDIGILSRPMSTSSATYVIILCRWASRLKIVETVKWFIRLINIS